MQVSARLIAHGHYRGRSAGGIFDRMPASRVIGYLLGHRPPNLRYRRIFWPCRSPAQKLRSRRCLFCGWVTRSIRRISSRHFDRVFSGYGQRHDRGPHGRSRPDQSCARIQGHAIADLLEDRISGLDAAAVAGLRMRSTFAVVGAASWSPGSVICSLARRKPTPMVFVAIIMLTLVGGITSCRV